MGTKFFFFFFFFFFVWARSMCSRCTAASRCYCVTFVLSYCFQTFPLSPPPVRLLVRATRETIVAKGGTAWARDIAGRFCLKCRLPRLHAANLLPLRRKEDFLPLKIRRLRPGLNLRTWGNKGQHATSRLPKLQWVQSYFSREQIGRGIET